MMLLQIYFAIEADRTDDFETMYAEVYVPALRVQQGYMRSDLLRLFPPDVTAEIKAVPTEYNYQMELVFDTEANRRLWAASPEHVTAWDAASGMASQVAWRAYDMVDEDQM